MSVTVSEPALEAIQAPTEDDLPYSDGMPMESHQHVLQTDLLKDPLLFHWHDRQDFFLGANMFVYFSPHQVRTHDFRGPDLFVALGVSRRARKSWVTWEEGKGPDVVIELLSDTTAAEDKGQKKQIYQDRLRVPEYFWFHPFTGEWAGFVLQAGVYQPLAPDAAGRLPSGKLGLTLVRWEGEYQGIQAVWLRWATAEGVLLPTPEEAAGEAGRRADEERRRADEERRQAEQARERAEEAARRAEDAEALLEQTRQRAARLAERLRALGVEPDEPAE